MIHCRTIDLPPVNRKEVLRYAGTREETPEITQLLDSALAEVKPTLSGTVCWREFPLAWQDGMPDLGFVRIQSDALRRNLQGCDRIVLFAATVGLGLDRLIARYSRVSPSRALMLQAIGTERISRQIENLDFIPLLEERFDFVIKKEAMETEPVKKMMKVLNDPAFRKEIAHFSGNDYRDLGKIICEV